MVWYREFELVKLYAAIDQPFRQCGTVSVALACTWHGVKLAASFINFTRDLVKAIRNIIAFSVFVLINLIDPESQILSKLALCGIHMCGLTRYVLNEMISILCHIGCMLADE